MALVPRYLSYGIFRQIYQPHRHRALFQQPRPVQTANSCAYTQAISSFSTSTPPSPSSKFAQSQPILKTSQTAYRPRNSHRRPQLESSMSKPSPLAGNAGNAGNVNQAPEVRDKKVAPSELSGGIPDPSIEYHTLSATPTTLLPYPRRILVVIDLNGTMLFRPNKQRPKEFEPRPYASRFLRYCINTFNVVIWSSARKRNVTAMMNLLVSNPADRNRIVAIWSRDHFDLSKDDYQKRVQCYKRLHKLWDDPNVIASHPLQSGGVRWTQCDTVLIDDSIEKGRSEPYNLIEVPEFAGQEDLAAPVLPQVHDYLNTLSFQSNISNYMRFSPFGLDPNYSAGVPNRA